MRNLHKSLAVVGVLFFASATSANADDPGPIIAEGIVAAPVGSVWAAWSTGKELRQWLAPHAEIDLRVGGLMRANYDPAGALGDRNTIENVVLSFDPHRMLSIRVARAPEGFPFPEAVKHMWTVVYFDEVGPDRTRVRVVGLGFQADEESQRMRAFFEHGNAVTIEQLQRHFTQSSMGDAP